MCDFGLDNHLINDSSAPVRVSAGSPPHALVSSIARACVWSYDSFARDGACRRIPR
ncbi:MAG: hypothetical protein R2856_14065 [Caldilineaceae bacterium]